MKVDSNETSIRTALAKTEDRMMARVQGEVCGMVREQLRAAGFDSD